MLTAVAEVCNTYAYLPEMRDAVERWGTHFASLVDLQKARNLPELRPFSVENAVNP